MFRSSLQSTEALYNFYADIIMLSALISCLFFGLVQVYSPYLVDQICFKKSIRMTKYFIECIKQII